MTIKINNMYNLGEWDGYIKEDPLRENWKDDRYRKGYLKGVEKRITKELNKIKEFVIDR